MCGLAGFVDTSRQTSSEVLTDTVARMTATLRHRGPDDGGAWVDAAAGVALGHRRLSIVDLSPAGHQPMVSHSARYVVTFNGEIYNFEALRAELAASNGGHATYRGHSDTEVMLACFERWGVERSLQSFNGMFAFALWDRIDRMLFLARDRLGEKPLYYALMGRHFLFGSELKSLRAHPGFRGEIDRDALALYLRHACVPAPYSIFGGVRKLPPGCWLTLRPEAPHAAAPVPYWSARAVAESGESDAYTGDDGDACADLDALLRDAVAMRMVADVPLGAFLSGGIDSSLVVALMQAQTATPVRTFSIGFHESEHDEAVHAKSVAAHLGTDHTELYVTPQMALDVVPMLPSMYDEPFADSSQIPTYLVSRLARSSVTVALSGDGGDELFGGYVRYLWAERNWQRMSRIPLPARRAVAGAMHSVSPSACDMVFRVAGRALPASLRQHDPSAKLRKAADAWASRDERDLCRCLVSFWNDPQSAVIGSCEPPTILSDREQWANVKSLTGQLMYLDSVTYLTDQILAKVDRASMRVSLEARIPLLDHRVVEFAARLPMRMKIHGAQGKWLLRQLLYRYVPQVLVERRKMGFVVPVDAWLRGPLRAWADDLLSERRLREDGLLDSFKIRKTWTEHTSGRRNWQARLWPVLMLQAWLAENPI